MDPASNPPAHLADPNNGLLAMLPPKAREAVSDFYFERPELFELDEPGLRNHMRATAGYSPGTVENALRIKFWIEYDYAMSDRVPMDLRRVCAGICTVDYFENRVMKVPLVAAWVLCRPLEYKVRIKEALDAGLRALRRILDQEPGPKDYKLMELQLKITKMMDERDQGGIIQRIEQKTASVSMVKTEHTISPDVPSSMEALQARLAQIQMKEKDLLGHMALRPEKTVETAMTPTYEPAPKKQREVPEEPSYPDEIA